MPASTFINVDLPAPFSPASASTSPARTSRSTPCSTGTPANALRTPVMRSAPALVGRRVLGRDERRRHQLDLLRGRLAVGDAVGDLDALVAHADRVLRGGRLDQPAVLDRLDRIGRAVDARDHD